LHVDEQFVQSCGLLRDMADVFGSNTHDDPVPLRTVRIDQLQHIIDYDREFCGPSSSASLGEFMRCFTPLQCLELWRLADYLDHSPMEIVLVNHMADIIRFAEPARVMELFDIQEEPTDDQLKAYMEQYPFLKEV
jgi:hypothetical protein